MTWSHRDPGVAARLSSAAWSRGLACALLASSTACGGGLPLLHPARTLASGEVRVTTLGGSTVTAQADEGFLSVENDTVTIVARQAELA